MTRDKIFKNMILAGGPPRGGTTLLAKILNSHPNISVAMDNMVMENWGLYYFKTRVGLINQLREEKVNPEEARFFIERHLIKDNNFKGLAPSDKLNNYPLAPPPERPDLDKAPNDIHIKRHLVPLELVGEEFVLCLKSPEISFVLPQLSKVFTDARFILTFRPAIEIAESMFRKGYEWGNSYHRRWIHELDPNGEPEAPPGVPEEWFGLWKKVSDFKKCVIYATSYLRAIGEGLAYLDENKAMLYDHLELCRYPDKVLNQISHFLHVSDEGFSNIKTEISDSKPKISLELQSEYDEIAEELRIKQVMDKLGEFTSRVT